VCGTLDFRPSTALPLWSCVAAGHPPPTQRILPSARSARSRKILGASGDVGALTWAGPRLSCPAGQPIPKNDESRAVTRLSPFSESAGTSRRSAVPTPGPVARGARICASLGVRPSATRVRRCGCGDPRHPRGPCCPHPCPASRSAGTRATPAVPAAHTLDRRRPRRSHDQNGESRAVMRATATHQDSRFEPNKRQTKAASWEEFSSTVDADPTSRAPAATMSSPVPDSGRCPPRHGCRPWKSERSRLGWGLGRRQTACPPPAPPRLRLF
jgi:hypothetical protein